MLYNQLYCMTRDNLQPGLSLDPKRRDIPLDFCASSSCKTCTLLAKRYHPVLLDPRFTNTASPRFFDYRIRTRLANDMTTYKWLVFTFLLFRLLFRSIITFVFIGGDNRRFRG